MVKYLSCFVLKSWVMLQEKIESCSIKNTVNIKAPENRIFLWLINSENIIMWCSILFSRPDAKLKKKQTPHDEALQILKPQMNNPPAPQVNTNLPDTSIYI